MNSSHLLEMMEVVDNLTVEVSLPPPSQTTAAIVIKGTNPPPPPSQKWSPLLKDSGCKSYRYEMYFLL